MCHETKRCSLHLKRVHTQTLTHTNRYIDILHILYIGNRANIYIYNLRRIFFFFGEYIIQPTE